MCCWACFYELLRTEPRTLQMLVSTPPSLVWTTQSQLLQIPHSLLHLPPLISGPSCVEKQLGRGRWWPPDSLYFMTVTKPVISLVQPKKGQGRDHQGHLVTVWQGWDFGMKAEERLLSSWKGKPSNRVFQEGIKYRGRKSKGLADKGKNESSSFKWDRSEVREAMGRHAQGWCEQTLPTDLEASRLCLRSHLSSWRQDGSKHFSQGGEYLWLQCFQHCVSSGASELAVVNWCDSFSSPCLY